MNLPTHRSLAQGHFDFVLLISSRSELVCQSYVLRKNRNRGGDDGRLKTGKKVDGLFHNRSDRAVEYGVVESSRSLTAGDVSSKWISDHTKLRKNDAGYHEPTGNSRTTPERCL